MVGPIFVGIMLLALLAVRRRPQAQPAGPPGAVDGSGTSSAEPAGVRAAPAAGDPAPTRSAGLAAAGSAARQPDEPEREPHPDAGPSSF
jgi:hypothetical protein